MNYKIGDKLKPKKGCEGECGIYEENNGAYIVITDISPSSYYYYDIYDKNNTKVRNCEVCFTDYDLEPYEEHTFKVGYRVEVIDCGESYTTIPIHHTGLKNMTNYKAVEGRRLNNGDVASVVSLSGIYVGVEKDGEHYVIGRKGIVPVSNEKKQFIVHCQTEDLWRRVQTKMFSEGYEWCGIGKKYKNSWVFFKEQSCISITEGRNYEMTYQGKSYYKNIYPSISIIEATEYLGEEDKEKEMEATRREYMTQTYVDMMEAFSKSYIIDPYMLNPIKNSPAKEHKNPIMTGLKKVTNFIDSLQEPLKNYIRLGWVELGGDEYYSTNEGRDAFMDIQFGLVKHKTLEAYAEAEVKRLEKEEKKK